MSAAGVVCVNPINRGPPRDWAATSSGPVMIPEGKYLPPQTPVSRPTPTHSPAGRHDSCRVVCAQCVPVHTAQLRARVLCCSPPTNDHHRQQQQQHPSLLLPSFPSAAAAQQSLINNVSFILKSGLTLAAFCLLPGARVRMFRLENKAHTLSLSPSLKNSPPERRTNLPPVSHRSN